jgi:rubrerythrin
MADETQGRVTQDEVLQMAVKMEELGRDFYEALGGATRDPRIFQLCHRIAAEEDKHREIVRRLHRDLAARGESGMLTEEQADTARRRLNERVIPTSDTIRQVACGGNVLDALNMAVKMEAESVMFYTHLAENLPPGNDIEAVIAEERTHLRLLSAVRCGMEAGR